MKVDLKNSVKPKVSYSHLIWATLVGFVFAATLYILVIPFTYFFLYGEGESSSRVSNQPLNRFIQEWGALFLLLTGLSIIAFNALRTSKTEKASAYAIAAVFLTVLYMLRFPMGSFLLGVLQ